MKVSTDGVLLGAYANLPTCGTVLDIGTGTGLLSLMLAQRLQEAGISPQIQAVELDASAVSQAQKNIQASPWSRAIQVVHADFLAWQTTQTQCYGAIVCNPPYWQAGHPCRDEARAKARTTTTLSHENLLLATRSCLRPEGFFSLILPVLPAKAFCEYAQQNGWFLAEYVQISEQRLRAPHRILLKLALSPQKTQRIALVIRDADGHYSDEFRSLTSAFYLSL
jgi:tRNA1Val (adenine37-N6)-methyltransferase